MYRKLLGYCAAMSFRRVLVAGLLLAVLIEGVTVLLRFGLDWESTRKRRRHRRTDVWLTRPSRLPGRFPGAARLVFPARFTARVVDCGVRVDFLRSVAHHFFVLWPITGSPQFDLVYPTHPYWKR